MSFSSLYLTENLSDFHAVAGYTIAAQVKENANGAVFGACPMGVSYT